MKGGAMKRDAKERFVSEKPDAGEEKVYATGFKGFAPGMVCRGKQYAENTVFDEKDAVMCKSGMHFCKNPLDVLDYYPLLNDNCELNEFATVEALSEPKTDGEKSVTEKLKIGARIGLGGFIKCAVDFSLTWLKKVDYNDASQLAASGRCSKLASSGRYSQLVSSGDASQLAASGRCSKLASSGRYSQLASSGDASQLASSGDDSQLAASGDASQLASSGDASQLASSGDASQLAASGRCSQLASSGRYSQLAASGRCSKLASSGDASQLASSGRYSQLAASGRCSKLAASGDDSSVEATSSDCVVASVGKRGKVRGALGCFLACAEWKKNDSGEWHPVRFISAKVDGRKIKADTWYTVKDGKFVEVEE